ncbi:MAG: wax ester/triacylglycerol synthase family O-acyltransferase, partial [Gammaproteobacteria bacterium]|nr:wax ester/triacylglycerol synthase family O-acyltransferase [Gammaproteobacteria bacterium]
MLSLSGLDAFHIHRETRIQHNHTIKLAILDPSSAHDKPELNYETFKQSFAHGISIIPPFHWRLVNVPLNVGLPRWYYDPELDINYHVRRAAVPSPGGERELAEVVSEIASTTLERDRPLWQIWFVEGLEHGHIALVTKLHHALADGRVSAKVLIDSFQETPDPVPDFPPHEYDLAEPIPSSWDLFKEASADDIALIKGFPRMVLRTLRYIGKVLWRKILSKPGYASAFSGPPTRFNQKLTPHRWYASVDLSVADLKEVKNAVGGTLNDVFIAVASGALRTYLGDRGELPDKSLTCNVPVSLRGAQFEGYGNRVGSWFLSIASDLDDPIERLQQVSRNTEAAREHNEACDRELNMDWMAYRTVWSSYIGLFKGMADKLSPNPAFNVILSNVKGPGKQLWSNGSKIVAVRSMGPLAEDMGLNITCWSYVDTLNVGLVGCRENMPDIWDLADQFPIEMQKLLDA